MDALAMVLEIVLGLLFLFAGSSKVFGAKMQVESFKHLRLPQWFRVVTGLTQYIGVIAIVIGFWEPSWSAWAGIWFGIMMVCAVAAHIRAKDSFAQMAAPIVLIILSVAIALIERSELSNFPG